MVNTRRFYKELGNLFYAIAAADKKIRKEERDQLEKEIQQTWRHHDHTTDRFGSDRAFLIEFEFEAMEDDGESSETAYSRFETFFTEFASQIDIASRHAIFNSARHIAECIRKINTAELGYLVRLKKLMNL
ncbi:MAG: hypothetical protein IPH18_15000 [Chitinophagaceae bacterium]|nr:hypothetical protein [Chitinophagaceae bacterium]MBK8952611.1 hypothetical protein [Chitinophagaceae bacterium]